MTFLKTFLIIPFLALFFNCATHFEKIEAKTFWNESSFKKDISLKVFNKAIKGYNLLTFDKRNLLVVIDYTKPSTEERFYVIDLVSKKILYKTLVAHGKNTGNNMATSFSNKPNSLKTSLGFFKTAEIYNGKHGVSLRLDGLENDINDNARSRAIVIHGANYVSNDFIKKNQRLGRSWGCPALPNSVTEKIIHLISEGTCIFVYSNDKEYFLKSEVFNKTI